MGVEDRIRTELAKIIKPETLKEAEQNYEDFKKFNFDANLITILLADGAISSEQAEAVMERAQTGKEYSSTSIAAKETVKKALSALPGAKQTLILTNKNEENIEVPDTLEDDADTIIKPTVATAKPRKEPAKPKQQRYMDFKLLGEGGMGAVYRCRNVAMDREEAMKIIRPEITGVQLLSFLARFNNEIKITAQLEDERIVRAYNVGRVHGGTPFMTMEFVRGESLEDVLDKIHFDKKEHVQGMQERKKGINEYLGTLPKLTDQKQANRWKKRLAEVENQLKPEEINTLEQAKEQYLQKYNTRELMRLFEEACRAVGFANSKGYIHRDIKPGNIMIKRGEGKEPNRAKLMDFGISIHVDDPVQGNIVGTPQYMGPEQAKGEKQSPLQDVYSLGATLYKMLTGRCPLDGENAQKILMKIIDKKHEPIHPSKIKEGIKEKPPELCAIAMKALEKDSELRYQTADELADDIKNWLEYKPTTAYTENWKEWRTRTLKRSPWLKYAAGGMAGILALSLAVGGPLLYISENKARQKAEQAQIEKQKAEKAEKGKTKAEQDTEAERKKKEQAQEQERKAKEDKEGLKIEQEARAEKRREALNEYDKGRDFLKRRDYENAERYFDKAISIDDLADAHFEKGLIKYSNFDGYEAVKEFERANSSSVKDAKKIHAQALFYAGFVNIDHLENPKKAGEYFRELISKATDDDDYFVILAKSLSAFTEEKYEEAIRLADTATQKYKNCWEGWLLRALFRMQGVGGPFNKPGLLEHRDFPIAFAALDTALEKNPEQVRCLERRIKLNCATSKPEAALKDAKYLAEKYPNEPAALTSLGLVQHALGEYRESIKTVEAAERLEKKLGTKRSSAFFVQGLNYMKLAEKEQNNEHYKKSEEYFGLAMGTSPTSEQHAQRAFVRLQLNNPGGALEDLKEALKKDPKNGRAHCNMGLYYITRREKEPIDEKTIINEFEEAIAVRFNDAYRELGLFYLSLNKKKEAKQALQTYLDKGMTEKRKETEKLIQEIEKQK